MIRISNFAITSENSRRSVDLGVSILIDVHRRDDAMFQCIRGAMNSLTNQMVMDDTAPVVMEAYTAYSDNPEAGLPQRMNTAAPVS